MYSFKPAICLTPVIPTGAQDVPKLLLGSVNSKSHRKSGLQKTLLLFVGEETGYAELTAAAVVPNGRACLRRGGTLKINSFQINITETFPHKYCALCCFA